MRNRIFSFLSLALLFAPPIFAAEKICRPDTCANRISKLSDYQALAADLKLGPKQVAVVKLVYKRDHQGSGDVYFINTKKYSYHFDFSEAFLGVRESVEEFNKNYEGDGSQRDYILGSLVLWPTSDGQQFLLELWNGDTLSAEYLSEFMTALKKDLKVTGSKLLFHPLGVAQEIMIADNQFKIPFIKTTELFKNETYVPLNEGVAYGRVKFIEDGADECLDHTKIAVYSHIPNDVGLIGGVITEEFQTPLSHINVKSMNRGTVNMSLKNAKALLKQYVGKAIKLEVNGTGYKVTVLPQATADQEITRFWKNKRPVVQFDGNVVLNPRYDKELVNLQKAFKAFPKLSEHQNLVGLVGAKAANLGVLVKLADYNKRDSTPYFVPHGYGVPFNFYEQFMNYPQKNLDAANPEKETTPLKLIRSILEEHKILDETAPHSFCDLKPVLANIRQIMQKSQVPPQVLLVFKKALLDDVTSPVHQSKVSKIRLRSSTNSEDMEGFSGAGLYNSTDVWLYGKKDGIRTKKDPMKWEKISEKLKEEIPYIYSSVWNDRAFEEREWYSINGKKHLEIKVGMALHRGFPFEDLDQTPGEIVNGVTITSDIYDEKAEGKIYINSQHFDLAVTNPPTKEELIERGGNPEIPYSTEEISVTAFLSDWDKDQDPNSFLDWSYSILSKSSMNRGESVLKDTPGSQKADEMEVRKLARVFKDLDESFAKVYGKNADDFILDIEWKLIGPKRELWIKQARPFNPRSGETTANNVRARMGFAPAPALKAPPRPKATVGPKPRKR